MGGYSFGTNDTDTKVKSKSAVSLKGRKKSKDEEDEEEEENENKKQKNIKKNGNKESIQKTVNYNMKEINLNEDNQFLSFTQINEIDINDYQQENHLFQDNSQGDFNHDQYHLQIQEKIKQKEQEYFQKLSLEFYTQQRIPQNEQGIIFYFCFFKRQKANNSCLGFNDFKQMLLRQKEIYEKQPCVNVNNLLNFEKKLSQLDRIWEDIKYDLNNNQMKQTRDEEAQQTNSNYKNLNQMKPHQCKNLDEMEGNQYFLQEGNKNGDYNYQENYHEKENQQQAQNCLMQNLHKQQQSTNTKNVQKVTYQFIKPNKKVVGVKTEHSPQNLRESPYTGHHNNQNGNSPNNRQQYPIQNAHSPKSRSNPQKPNNHGNNGKQINMNDYMQNIFTQTEGQIQRMYAPFNISKSNQQLNGFQKNQNEINTYPRIKSSAIRGYSPPSRPNNNNIKSVKMFDNQSNSGQATREQNNNIQTNESQPPVGEATNKKNIYIKKQLDSDHLLQGQKVKIISSETNNKVNRSFSPNSGRALNTNENQQQKTNFILKKPPQSSNVNKVQNNSSPIKKEGHQFFRITSHQKQSHEQGSKSPQQQAHTGTTRVTANIQNTKKRPNSPNHSQKYKKNENNMVNNLQN